MLWALFVLDTGALVAWEALAAFGVEWLRARWAVRILAAASGVAVTWLAMWSVLDVDRVGAWAIVAYVAWLAAVWWAYRRRVVDLFVLAGAVLSAIVVVTAMLARNLLGRETAGSFLLIGLAVIGMAAVGALVAQAGRRRGDGMSPAARAALWGRLQANGLVVGDCPSPGESTAPWYVRTMLGIAGWIGAAFLLGFVGVALQFVMRSGSAALIVGLVLCAVAIVMLWTFTQLEFFAQFALAVSLAGQLLVVFGLFSLFPHRDPFSLVVIAAFEAALVPLAPYALHRTFSALVAAVALMIWLHALHASFLVPGLAAAAFVALQFAETQLVKRARMWRAASTGVVLALLAMIAAGPLLQELRGWFGGPVAMPDPAWASVGSMLVGLLFVGTAAWLLARSGIALHHQVGLTAIGGSVALAAAAWPVPGVIAGVLIAVAAFAAGRAAMTGLGLVIAAAAISYYYYSLAVPLLTKAVSLLAAGAVVLAARYAVRYWIGAIEPEVRDA